MSMLLRGTPYLELGMMIDSSVPEPRVKYTHGTARLSSGSNEPTTRSPDRVRTHAELEASRISDPSLEEGLSLRMAMTNQGENDQFPHSTDRWGKQR